MDRRRRWRQRQYGRGRAELRATATFEIRFVWKVNGGKDGAVNVGLDMAAGDLVAVIDDYDYFLPTVFHRWQMILLK